MSQLTQYILHGLYEATGDTWRSVDVVATLQARWPQLATEDIKRGMVELAGRGLITLRGGEGLGHISGPGIQALSGLWKSGAFGPVPPAAAQHVDRLHALAEAQSTTDIDSSVVGRPAAQLSAIAAVDAHAAHIRGAITAITQQISAAPELSMDDWARALDLIAELDFTLDSLTANVRR